MRSSIESSYFSHRESSRIFFL